MKVFKANQIRNIGIVGHGSEGKTTLAEAIFYNAGLTDRIGKVSDGTTLTDYDSEEIKRKISISTAMASFEWQDNKVNVLDVPGYFDFVSEIVEASYAVDSFIIVMNPVSGFNVGAEKACDMADKFRLSKLVFINQMDRENADFNKVIDQLKSRYGTSVVILQIPILEGKVFKGYVDLLSMNAYEFAKNGNKQIDIPPDLKKTADALHEQIIESAAESDDALLEKFFAGEDLKQDEIINGLRNGVSDRKLVPVLLGSALFNINIKPLMDCIVQFLPSPQHKKVISGLNTKTGKQEDRDITENNNFSAQVFKTFADPFVGKLSLIKVKTGTLKPDMILYNSNRDKLEKSGTVYIMKGKKQIPAERLEAGDIGALSKLQFTLTGDTISEQLYPIQYDDIVFPDPTISLAVEAKNQGEEDKVFAGLHRIEEEDPTFKVVKNVETAETLISGVGELHLEVMTKRLSNKFGVDVVLKEPKIPYRETIRKDVKAEGKHKKQSGGHGQFGHCWVEFQPITGESKDFEFVDNVVGGVVPRQYIPAVEKGLRESIQKGVLAGYPVVGIRCILYDGSYHSVDSSEMAFKIAAHLAFKKGCMAADPVILEPVYHAEICVPEEFMGDVIGDMNRRRGRILGMNPVDDNYQQVVAEVPLSEMSRYTTDLRSMTQAKGYFSMNFERYEEVPPNISVKIIENAKKTEEKAEED